MLKIVDLIGVYSNGTIKFFYLYKVKINNTLLYVLSDEDGDVIIDFDSLDKAKKSLLYEGFVEMNFCIESWDKS